VGGAVTSTLGLDGRAKNYCASGELAWRAELIAKKSRLSLAESSRRERPDAASAKHALDAFVTSEHAQKSGCGADRPGSPVTAQTTEQSIGAMTMRESVVDDTRTRGHARPRA
jgi:hypothetical protein